MVLALPRSRNVDAELAKLYGVTPRRTRTLRIGVWSVTTVLILTVGGFAYTQRTTAVSFATTPQPDLLFGLRGTNQGVPSDYPGGTGTACNEEEFTAATGALDLRFVGGRHQEPADRAAAGAVAPAGRRPLRLTWRKTWLNNNIR